MLVAEALASGHILTHSLATLTNLSHCHCDIATGEMDPHKYSPLWVFQLWLHTYFVPLRLECLAFKEDEVMGF